MGTKTNNLGLYMPADGEVAWGDAVNGNASILDAQISLPKNWVNYIITGLLPPQVGATTFQYAVQAGSALVNGVVVSLASAVTETIPANYIHDVFLNSDGTITVDGQAATSYAQLKVATRSQVLVCRVQSDSNGITGITPMGNAFPVLTDSQDNGLSVYDFVWMYYIAGYSFTGSWVANTAYKEGDYYVTSTGWYYRVLKAGTSGASAPDTIYVNGKIGAIQDGTCWVLFNGTSMYQECFQYAQAGGINWYFSNLAVAQLVNGLANYYNPTWQAGDIDLAVWYIEAVFQHCITSRVSSGTYQYGMKMHTAGFIWVATSGLNGGAGNLDGTTAATSPFGTGYGVGSTVTDGTVTWEAIYPYYGTADWFWLDVDVDFQTYKAPDSHDSYASTFAYLIWRYCSVMNNSAWLTEPSSQPSGDQTYYTYQQVLTNILTSNLVNQVANNLTYTFQGAINPKDGTSYNIQFLEDNCESYQGAVAAQAVYDMLNDTTDANTMINLETSLATGIAALYGTSSAGNSFFLYYYGAENSPTDSWNAVDGASPAPAWYPYLQCQFWPELCGVPVGIPDIASGVMVNEAVRAWVASKWPSWWQDSSKDTTVDGFAALLAVLSWRDPLKAAECIRMIEQQHMSGAMADSLFIHDYGFCLRAKERLAPKYAVISATSTAITLEDDAGNVTTVTLPTVPDSPVIEAKEDLTAQSADIAATGLLMPSADGFYRLSAYVVVTQAATTSSTLPDVQFNWTDPDGTAQAFIATSNDSSNTLTTHAAGDTVIYAKGGDWIMFQTGGYASSGATAMQYAVHIRAEAL